MTSRIFRYLSTALALAVFSALGFAAEPELSADTPITADFNSNELVAAGNARFEHEDVVVEADEIRFNQGTRVVTATGNVRVTRQGVRIVSEHVTYHIDTRAFSSGRFRAGSPPIFIEGEQFSGDLEELEIDDARVYYLEPDSSSLSVKLKHATIWPDDRIKAEGVAFKLPFIGTIPLPSIDRELDAPTLRFEGKAGYRSRSGAFIQSEILIPLNEQFDVGANLDLYTRRGVLIGPALRYHRSLEEGGSTTVSLSSGWIADQGDGVTRGEDVLSRDVPQQRYLGDLDVAHHSGDFELVLHTAVLSDSEVERDFRSDRFNSQPQPDSFLEVNQLVGDDVFLSLFVERNPNEFFRNVERAPEITLEMPFKPVGDTGVLHAAKARFMRFRAYGETAASNLSGDDLALYREAEHVWPESLFLNLDTDDYWREWGELTYSVRRPVGIQRWGSFTPLAEIQCYALRTPVLDADGRDSGESISGDGTRTQVGFDLDANLYADFKVESRMWGITGLRHLLQPSVQVRLSHQTGQTPPTDYFPSFHTTRPEIDLITRRDLTGIDERELLVRTGLKNSLLGKESDGHFRELANLGLYYDTVYGGSNKQELSSAYVEFTASPARWLEFSLDQRIDFGEDDLDELRLRTTLRSAEAWELSLSTDFLDGVYHQYRLGGAYRLTERATFIVSLRFDANRDEFTRQSYGVRYHLGQAWEIEGALVLRNGAQREDDISFEASVQLLQF